MKSLVKAKEQFRRTLLILGGFSLVVNLLLLAMPLYMLQIYDRILPSRSMDTLMFLSVIAIGALVVLGMLEAVRSILASRAAAKLESEIAADALRVSMNNSRIGEANIEPMRNLAVIRQFVSSRSVFALLDLPFAPLFIAILYIIHPTLFWLTLAGAVVLLIVAVFNQQLTNAASTQSSMHLSSAMTMAQSLARNSESLRAMGMSGNGISLWGRQNAESLIAQGRVDSRNAMLSGLSRTLRMGLQIAILGVGAWLVLNDEMTAGMIFAASIISGRGLQPIDQVIGGWKQFIVTRRAWFSLKELLSSAGDETEKTSMNRPAGQVSVEAALVVAPQGLAKQPILNRVSFKLNPGEVLGVVGPSGSGKSTLARLLVGAQIPQAGAIRIDGTDIQNWDPVQLGQSIGYLGQEVELLPGTIKENIARLSDQPDDAAVLEAAQKAQVHELIQNLPQGYDTPIGPGGMGLSGGQRQRIGLARAFYGNPQIMILDEPNANLDDDGEVALHRALIATRDSDITTIIITQRKLVLNLVDKILRMHSGKVDFFGSRDEFVSLLQERKRQAEMQNPKMTTPSSPVQNRASGKNENQGRSASPYRTNINARSNAISAVTDRLPNGSNKQRFKPKKQT